MFLHCRDEKYRGQRLKKLGTFWWKKCSPQRKSWLHQWSFKGVKIGGNVWRSSTGLKRWFVFLRHSVCIRRSKNKTRWLIEIACVRHCCVVDVLITRGALRPTSHVSADFLPTSQANRPDASKTIRQHILWRRISKPRLARRRYSWLLTVITVAAARILATERVVFVFSCLAWRCWTSWVSGI